MALTKNQKLGIGISAGVLLLAGGATAIYFSNKNKEGRTGGSGSGSGAGVKGKNKTSDILLLTDPSITNNPTLTTIQEVIKVVGMNNINATDEEINHVALALTAQAQPDNRKPLTQKESSIFGLVLRYRQSQTACVKNPNSIECKKEKCRAVVASAGRGAGTINTQTELCKQLLGLPFNKCIINPSTPECVIQAGQGRGADGISFA